LLDADEKCHSVRILLAEWLEERGDARATGYRWLCEHGIVPQDYRGTKTWDWNDVVGYGAQMTGSLPHELFIRLTGGKLANDTHCRLFLSRLEAEEALCQAILRQIPENGEFVDPGEHLV